MSDGHGDDLPDVADPRRDGRPAEEGTDALTVALRLSLGAAAMVVDQVAKTVAPPPPSGGVSPTDAPSDTTPPESAPPRAVALAVGAIVEGRETAAALVGTVRRAAEPVAPLVAWTGRLPLVGSARRATIRRLDEMARRGTAELSESRDLVDRFVDTATDRAMTSPAVPHLVGQMSDDLLPEVLAAILPVAIAELTRDPEVLGAVIDAVLPTAFGSLSDDPEALLGVVDAVIGPVIPGVLDMLRDNPDLIMGMISPMLEPMIDEVLPVALGKLNEDPSTVRSLVLDQSTGMATEMANSVRSRTVSADDLAESIVRRLTFRKPRVPALPAGDPTVITAPDPDPTPEPATAPAVEATAGPGSTKEAP